MGFLKSIIYGSTEDVEQNFCDYTETFGKHPAVISCDMNFINTLPNKELSCCVKIQMDVFVREDLPNLISDSEVSYISTVRSILGEHIGGRFVGQGVIASQSTAFLIYYIPERQAKVCKKMLNETFMGSFRHVETSVVYDPDGSQYMRFLYPNTLQKKKIDNARILKMLKGYGDDGTKPRPVKFNIVFQNKKAAMAMSQETMSKGFIYKDMIEESAPEGMVLPRQRLVLEKTIPFNIDLLMLIDNYLLKLSEKYEGEYKSLETDVIE